MLIFGWSKELECNIDIIDEQHKKFMKAANIFFIRYAAQKERDLEGAKKYLEFLQDYILYHFQAEEAFQVECGYPDYLNHQASHKAMAQRVKFLAVELQESHFSAEKMEEFEAFSRNWIEHHILTEDKLFAKCYREYKEGLKQEGKE